MTSRNEHSIDKLFSKGLSSYGEKAPDYSWSVISGELRKQKRVRYLSITKYAAAVAAILLAFYFGYEFSKSEFTQQQMARIEERGSRSQGNSSQFSGENLTPLNSLSAGEFMAGPLPGKVNSRDEYPVPSKIMTLPVADDRSITALASYEPDPLIAGPQDNLSLPERYWKKLLHQTDNRILAFNEKPQNNKKKKSSGNQWSLGGSFAPTYSYRTTENDKLNLFNNTGQSTENDPSSYEQAVITYSTGINAQYAMNDKWQIETGLYYSRFGHKKEALFVKNNDLDNGGLYHLNTSAGKVEGSRVPEDVALEIQGSHKPGDNPEDFTTNTSEDSRLFQKFDYVEIPMIVKYKIYDQKMNVNIISGLSTGLLVNNQTILETPDQRRNLGDTKNIRQVLNSTLLGVGFQFALSKKLVIDFEPTFKYGLHSINSSSEFGYKPYSLGVYSGIQYSF